MNGKGENKLDMLLMAIIIQYVGNPIQNAEAINLIVYIILINLKLNNI